MNNTLFKTEICCECNISFGVTIDFYNKRKNDHKSFHCPLGHSQYFLRKSDKEKLKHENEILKAKELNLKEELYFAKKSIIAYKGHLTRVKKKGLHDER